MTCSLRATTRTCGGATALTVRAVKRDSTAMDRLSCGVSPWLNRAARRLCRNGDSRSEEHTSELQSPMYLVCRLLLEKKKKRNKENKRQIGSEAHDYRWREAQVLSR